MNSCKPFLSFSNYIAYIQTPDGGHLIALRESHEDALEDAYDYAQDLWQEQFPGFAMPSSKAVFMEQYYRAGEGKISFDIVNFHPMENWDGSEIAAQQLGIKYTPEKPPLVSCNFKR